MWGTDGLAFLSRYDGLGGRGRAASDTIGGPSRDSVKSQVAPADGEFEPRDEAFLSTFCPRGAEGFVLDRTAIAAAVEKGHHLADLTGLLEDACEGGLPAGARVFFDDMQPARRCCRSRAMLC
jgi:hypothetical protein